MKNLLFLPIAAFVIFSCTNDQADVDNGTDDCGTYTYTNDVQSIINQSCATASCHGGSVQPTLTSYSVVESNKAKIQTRAIDQGTMPPSSSPQLSSGQLEILECWIKDGAVE